jgi:membrane fusion protein (multidrug efflux system)
VKQWLSAILILAAGAAALFWYVTEQETDGAAGRGGWQSPPPSVEITPVSIGAVVRTVEAVGTLRANEAITVRPEIAGRIRDIHFTEGQPVAAGDRLISLDDAVHRAEVAEKQADRRIAELAFDRADKLVAKRAASAEERDRALAELQSSDAALQLARAKLNKTRIVAPFAGVVGLRHVSSGDFVSAGQELVSLVEIHPLKVDFKVGEVYLPQVSEGQDIEVQVDAYPGETFTGRVFAIEPQVDISGRAVVIRARLPNEAMQLRPGLFSRVDLIVDAAAEAILIPEDAVVPRGDQHFVYRFQDDHVYLTEVVLGKRSESMVEVRSGLSRDAVVVSAGQIKLRDGIAVAPVEGNTETVSTQQVQRTPST